MRALLPLLPAQNVGSLASLPILSRRMVLVGLHLVTVTAVTGHFAAYSYIELCAGGCGADGCWTAW